MPRSGGCQVSKEQGLPVVPIVRNTQVQQQVLPSARLQSRANPANFGAPAIEGADNVVGVHADIMAKEQQHAEDIGNQDAAAKLAAADQYTLYNPETGLLNAKGTEATARDEHGQLVLQAKYQEEMNRHADEIGKGLGSERQREWFRQFVADRKLHGDGQIAQHLSNEIQRVDEESHKALVDTILSDGVIAADKGDIPGVVAAAGKIDVEVDKYSHRNNLTPVESAKKRADLKSAVYANAIHTLNNKGDSPAAKELFKQWKGELNGEDLTKLEGALKQGTIRDASRALNDEAMAKFPDDRKAQQAYIKKEKDTEISDAAMDRNNGDHALAEAAYQEGVTLTLRRASKAVASGGYYNISPADKAILAETGHLDDLKKLSKYLTDRVEPNMEDENGKGHIVFNTFMAEDRAKIAALSPEELQTKYRPSVDNSHWEAMQNHWQQAKQAEQTGKGAEFKSSIDFNDRIAAAARDAKWLTGKPSSLKSPADLARYDEYRNAVDTALHDGKVRTKEEQDKVIEGEALRYGTANISKSWWPDGTVRLNETLTKEQHASAYIPVEQIRKTDHAIIIRGLTALNNGSHKDDQLVGHIAYLMQQEDTAARDGNTASQTDLHERISRLMSGDFETEAEKVQWAKKTGDAFWRDQWLKMSISSGF